MATTMHPSPIPTPTSSAPPTPPYPVFPRLPSSTITPSISRNASTSSTHSTATTSSSTSSLAAAPMRPPPIETRTAATPSAQLPSRPSSSHSQAMGFRGGGSITPSHSHSHSQSHPPDGRSSRAAIRNGPRSRSTLPYSSPPLDTSTSTGYSFDSTPERSSTAPVPDSSPTTPRAPRWLPADKGDRAGASANSSSGPTVTISMDPTDQDDPTCCSTTASTSTSSTVTAAPIPKRGPNVSPLVMPRALRGRDGQWSTPSSPTDRKSPHASKHRTLSVDGRGASGEEIRERRISQASAASAGASGVKKPSLKDFVLGEELGRGSYSTVVQATSAVNTHSPTSPRPPRQYAIKIINQAHLVAEKKVKYAIIERDALIRLAQPSSTSPRGHRRGVSSSSSTGVPAASARRRSNASMNSAAGASKRDGSIPGSRDRLSVATDGGSSTTTSSSVPLSPILKTSLAGRRPSRSAEPPESVPERSEENVAATAEKGRSRPPSPVREESNEGGMTPPSHSATRMEGSPVISTAPPTPDIDGGRKSVARNRRQSLAPSERSVKSGRGVSYAHPGIIRLHSTFNDHTSLYFVLDLAKNGELLAFIRKYGSLDLVSARYYAAQLIDTIEFMHEREVIHRDLKPENILLDDEMRIKITDFGSAKIIGKETDTQDDGHKRSFVGSADFVSPEVLRNESAVFASDIWAFGCILYQLLVGKPPFRGATDYLTFQKILKRDFEYPEGFDPEARALVELVLNIDPAARPTPAEIKQHAFFSSIDFGTIWQIPAPTMSTGLTAPTLTVANAPSESDIWAVFDDEVSDGGFEFDEGETPMSERTEGDMLGQSYASGPRFDGDAAAEAVQDVDHPQAHGRSPSSGSLELPRPAFVEERTKKGRNWSVGSKSARTSSSSSNNRTALTGLLETMGIHSTTPSGGTPAGQGGTPRGSSRMSRASERSDEVKPTIQPSEAETKWSSLLLANERIIHAGSVTVRPTTSSAASTLIPSFLLPAPKRRQLILTDFPRLVEVKDDGRDDHASQAPRIKFEAVFVRQPSEGQPTAADYAAVGLPTAPAVGQSNGGANRVLDVVEKGSKGFVVHTVGASVWYLAETVEMRDQWVAAIRSASAP